MHAHPLIYNLFMCVCVCWCIWHDNGNVDKRDELFNEFEECNVYGKRLKNQLAYISHQLKIRIKRIIVIEMENLSFRLAFAHFASYI